jgi:large subunit ribosomal protein L23
VTHLQVIIIKPLLLEEPSEGKEKEVLRKTYTFDVNVKANKIQIRNALEKLYSIKGAIAKINTYRKPGKKRRRGRTNVGYTSERKKAFVIMKPGRTIKVL